MSSTHDSGLGHGSNGAPQGSIEEEIYPSKASSAEDSVTPPKYEPSPKHEAGHGWGSKNPVKSHNEGQHLLDTGYQHGKQIYNVTSEGKLVKFQPDGSPNNGYHSYEVTSPPDIPPSILKKMYQDGKITKTDYNKYLKGKKKQ